MLVIVPRGGTRLSYLDREIFFSFLFFFLSEKQNKTKNKNERRQQNQIAAVSEYVIGEKEDAFFQLRDFSRFENTPKIVVLVKYQK